MSSCCTPTKFIIACREHPEIDEACVYEVRGQTRVSCRKCPASATKILVKPITKYEATCALRQEIGKAFTVCDRYTKSSTSTS